MSKWIGLLLLTAALGANGQEVCDDRVAPAELPSSEAAGGQTLVLAGPARLQINLSETAATFVHASEMLIIKYPDGSFLSHRQLDESEMRPTHSSELAFPDFIRLVFRTEVAAASPTDREEADAIWSAITSACIKAKHYRLTGTDIFTYSASRADGERYHAFLIPDGDIVHYLDIAGSDDLAYSTLSTLTKRN